MRNRRMLLPALLVCATLVGGLQLHAQGRFYTTDQIDQMVAPIALYPDALMSQVLMAATFPDQVVDADRWVRANPGLTGPALDDALATATWDPSVIALCKFPTVLDRMADNVSWTTDLGYAFLDQRADVMNACQTLRRVAYQDGHLRTTPQQRVIYEDQAIIIQPYSPGVVYVPAYQPAVVFGPVWSYPTYYYPAVWAPSPGYAFVNGFAWGLGLAVGNVLFGGCDWNHHDVYVNNTVIVNNAIYHNTPYYQQAALQGASGPQHWTHYADRASYARGGTGAPYGGRDHGHVRGAGPSRGTYPTTQGATRADLQRVSGPSRHDTGRAAGPGQTRSPGATNARISPHGPEGSRSSQESHALPHGSAGNSASAYGSPSAHGPTKHGEGAGGQHAPEKAPKNLKPREGHPETHGPTGRPAPAVNRRSAHGPITPSWVYGSGRAEARGSSGHPHPANNRPTFNTQAGHRSGSNRAEVRRAGGYGYGRNPRPAAPFKGSYGGKRDNHSRI
jgi:hypothetical protein